MSACALKLWRYRGLQTVTLENEHLRVDLFPGAGAKIYNLFYKPKNLQLLWHHPQLEPGAVTLGASYDDNFSGGWDELFPNDAPTEFQGRNLPDHGELWCQPWDIEVIREDAEEVTILLRRAGTASAALMEKWITLRDGESMLRFRHRITNLGTTRLDFLWKLHPAMQVSEFHRVDVPGRRAEFVGPAWSRLDGALAEFDWPIARNARGEHADLRFVLPASSRKKDFIYVKELDDGWCAVTDAKHKVGFGLVFPREIFRWVWLFMPAGGWRGLNMVILEPCTAYPKDLHVASKAGHCARLEPGSVLECATLGVVFSGCTGVAGIDGDGTVTPIGEDE